MNNLFDIITSISSFLLILILIVILIEILFKILVFFKEKLFYRRIYRKDFLNKEYSNYLNWIEDRSKPMFNYIPIGLRHFNLDNKLVENSSKINSLGFRTYEFSKKQKNELRIVLLGGSTAWGCGSGSNETNISGHLEKIINTKKVLLGEKMYSKVFNLSQINGRLTQDILSLIFYMNELDADIVITLTGWNELITSYDLDKKILNKHKFFYLGEMYHWKPTQIPKVRNEVVKSLTLEWLSENSEILKLFLKNKSKSNFDITEKISKNLKLNSSIMVENFNIIKKISKGYKFKTLHFLQPNVYRKSFLSQTETKILELYEKHRPVHGGMKFANFLKNTNIYEFVLEELSKTSTKTVSLLDIFKKEKQSIFYTLVHVNDLGYKIMAEEIYKNLLININNNSTEQINNAQS